MEQNNKDLSNYMDNAADKVNQIATDTITAEKTTLNVPCLQEQLGTGLGSVAVFDYTPSGGGVYAFVAPQDLSSTGLLHCVLANAFLFAFAYCFQQQFAYFFKINKTNQEPDSKPSESANSASESSSISSEAAAAASSVSNLTGDGML